MKFMGVLYFSVTAYISADPCVNNIDIVEFSKIGVISGYKDN